MSRGASADLGRASPGTAAVRNSRKSTLKFDPPRASGPGCEACGQSFAPHPADQWWREKYPQCPPKRFCSERCRKRAESQRARQRKQENRNG